MPQHTGPRIKGGGGSGLLQSQEETEKPSGTARAGSWRTGLSRAILTIRQSPLQKVQRTGFRNGSAPISDVQLCVDVGYMPLDGCDGNTEAVCNLLIR